MLAASVQLGREHLGGPVFLHRIAWAILLDVSLRLLDRNILRPPEHRG